MSTSLSRSLSLVPRALLPGPPQLVGGFSSTLRPITLSLPLPLLEFCNETLLEHQLRALAEAGATEVIILIQEKAFPESWAAYIAKAEAELGLKIESVREEAPLGNAGAFKAAEAKITAGANPDTPFIVVNCDVMCTYPLRDLLHTHMKYGRECTVLTTRCTDHTALSNYGVVVVDERTGRVRHFVYRPQTFVSDVINAGVYVFSPSVFRRIETGRKVHMQDILPELANQEQLQSCLLSGHWVKMTDTKAYLNAVGPHLEIMRFMKPQGLSSTPADASYTIRGDVVIHPEAVIGKGSVLGPRVVVGKGCVVGEGVRIQGSTLLEGTSIKSHSLVKDSLVGWRCTIGAWSHVVESVFGEDVSVDEGLLVRGATVLPHKELGYSIREPQIVI